MRLPVQELSPLDPGASHGHGTSSGFRIVCASQITQVTIYARGALVTRRVILPDRQTLPDGDVDLVIEDLTALAEAGSMRAAFAAPPISGEKPEGKFSGRQIIAVRSALHVPKNTAEPSPFVARVQEIAGRLARAQAEFEHLQQERQKLAKTIPDPVLRTTSLVEKVDERIRDALATTELLFDIQTRVQSRLAEVEKQIADLQIALAAAELAASQAQSRPGTAQPTRLATISLGGSGPLSGLTLSYMVPAARFWPLYTLRLTENRDGSKEGGRRATWMIEALVAQCSGEDWRGVRLALSTADLLLDARLPELPSLRIGRAQPPPRRGYRPPPAGLDELFAGYDRAFREVTSTNVPIPEPHTEAAPTQGGAQDVLENTAPEQAILTGGVFDLRQQAMPPPLAGAKGRSLAPPAKSARSTPPPASTTLAGFAAASMPPPAPPSFMPAPAPGAAEPQRARRASRELVQRSGGTTIFEPSRLSSTLSEGGGYGGAPADLEDDSAAAPAYEPPDNWLDFDRLILCGPEHRARRGRLMRISESASLTTSRQASEQIESLRPAEGLSDPLTSRGHFDHRYEADGLFLVPSDGLAHRVVISSAETVPALRLLTVPRERPEVYREAELKNPCEVPLLAGPVDVYLEGSLLTTAIISAIDRGGALHVGMGVEERVRVARNVRSDEEVVGLLGGSTQMTHHVSIELSSALFQQCVIEVFESLPVSDDKSVTVELFSARPEPKEYTQAERGAPIRGGLIWRLLLPAGGKAKIEYQYRVLFPARTEIVGGNRRDS